MCTNKVAHPFVKEGSSNMTNPTVFVLSLAIDLSSLPQDDSLGLVKYSVILQCTDTNRSLTSVNFLFGICLFLRDFQKRLPQCVCVHLNIIIC